MALNRFTFVFRLKSNQTRPGGYEGRKEKDNEENIIQQGPGCGWRNPGEPDGCQDGDGGEAPHRRGNAGRTAIPAGDHPLCRMGQRKRKEGVTSLP